MRAKRDDVIAEYKASRTLVKSAPELWSEVSDAGSLKRHLDQFGEIHITRLEPETVVAWEGESARGTVKLEPSGWGTKVILTAAPAQAGPDGHPAGASATPSADAIDAEMNELNAVLELGQPARPRRAIRGRGIMRAFVDWLKGDHQPSERATEDISGEQASDAPERETGESGDPHGSAAAPALALNSALDSLGRAHHRPYSRA